MASFFMSFVKAGLKTANQMKNYAMDKIKGEEDELKRRKEEEEQHKVILKKAFFFFSDNSGHIDIVRNNSIEM